VFSNDFVANDFVSPPGIMPNCQGTSSVAKTETLLAKDRRQTTPQAINPNTSAFSQPTALVAQQRAIQTYPQWGVPGSPLNREFIERRNRSLKKRLFFFNDPNWPVTSGRDSQRRRHERQKRGTGYPEFGVEGPRLNRGFSS